MKAQSIEKTCAFEETPNGLVLVRVTGAAKYTTVRALSQIYGISRTLMEGKLEKLRQSHPITIIDHDGTRLIDIAEFNAALIGASIITK